MSRDDDAEQNYRQTCQEQLLLSAHDDGRVPQADFASFVWDYCCNSTSNSSSVNDYYIAGSACNSSSTNGTTTLRMMICLNRYRWKSASPLHPQLRTTMKAVRKTPLPWSS